MWGSLQKQGTDHSQLSDSHKLSIVVSFPKRKHRRDEMWSLKLWPKSMAYAWSAAWFLPGSSFATQGRFSVAGDSYAWSTEKLCYRHTAGSHHEAAKFPAIQRSPLCELCALKCLSHRGGEQSQLESAVTDWSLWFLRPVLLKKIYFKI